MTVWVQSGLDGRRPGLDTHETNYRRLPESIKLRPMTIERETKHEKKMRWLDDNEAMLEAKYPGMWVAVSDEGLAGVGNTPTEAIAEAKRKGFGDVLVDGIKAIEYQGKVLIR